MPYNFAADSFHIKKLCNRLFFKRSAILEGKLPFCVFEPPLGDLGATYGDHHWKARSGLPSGVN